MRRKILMRCLIYYFMILLFFAIVSFCILKTTSNPDLSKEILIKEALLGLIKNNQCTTNYALIDRYFKLLKQKNMQPSSPRKNRDEI